MTALTPADARGRRRHALQMGRSQVSSWTRSAMIAGLLVMVAAGLPAQAADETRLWEALRQGGRAVLLRHAIAPGGGC